MTVVVASRPYNLLPKRRMVRQVRPFDHALRGQMERSLNAPYGGFPSHL